MPTKIPSSKMPSSKSYTSSDPNKEQEVKIFVKREKAEFMMKITTTLNKIGAISRAFNDAVDLYLALDSQIASDDKELNCIKLDMVQFRKACKHKGDEEEALMIINLRAFLQAHGYEVKNLGFPLDKDDNVISDDLLYIDIKRK